MRPEKQLLRDENDLDQPTCGPNARFRSPGENHPVVSFYTLTFSQRVTMVFAETGFNPSQEHHPVFSIGVLAHFSRKRRDSP
jgi:hypothetical protein